MSSANADHSTMGTLVEARLLECIQAHRAEVNHVALDDRLADIGYDSLSFIELVVRMENEFGIDFADEQLDYRRYDRVRHLLRYVESLVAARGG